MPHGVPAAPHHHHHHRWWRRKLRLLATFDLWLGVAIAVVAVVGLITLFLTIARNVAICVAGVNC